MSGFKQDPSQLTPAYYRVVVTLAGGAATYPSAAGDNNGALYTQDHSGFATQPSTADSALRVARGHLRFLSTVESVTLAANAEILDVEFTSAGVTVADNQPTQVKFTVKYDVDSGIFESLKNTVDYAGVAITTSEQAVRQLVAGGICRGSTSGYTRRVRVWDPVALEERDQVVKIVQPDLPSKVIADVVVTRIDGTTL